MSAVQVESAQQVIQGMVEATESLNYDGVFVYRRGGHMDSMRIIHKNVAGAEVERLISLSGPAREVLRDGDKVTCVFADDQEIIVEQRAPREYLTLGLSQPLARLGDFYTFAVLAQDRVAGRTTRVVAITPNGADRYGYRLWIDAESGLLLKSVIVTDREQVLEEVQFTQITIGSEIPDSSLRPEIQGKGFTWYENEAEDAGDGPANANDPHWQVRWLPQGFELRESKYQQTSASTMPVSHVVYSDGLAMVSVFVEKLLGRSEPLRGFASMGAVNTFSHVEGGHQIIVVGEVPRATVREIAVSVSYAGPGRD